MQVLGLQNDIHPEKIPEGGSQVDLNGGHQEGLVWRNRPGLSRPAGIDLFSGAVDAVGWVRGRVHSGLPGLLVAHSGKIEAYGVGAGHIEPLWTPPPTPGFTYTPPTLDSSSQGVLNPFYWLSWNTLPYVDHYEISRDDEYLEDVPVETLEWADDEATTGEHDYEVVPVYQDGTHGEPLETTENLSDPGFDITPEETAMDVYDAIVDAIVGSLVVGEEISDAERPQVAVGAFEFGATGQVQLAADGAAGTYARRLVGIRANFVGGQYCGVGIYHDRQVGQPGRIAAYVEYTNGGVHFEGYLGAAWSDRISSALLLSRAAASNDVKASVGGSNKGTILTTSASLYSVTVRYGQSGYAYTYTVRPSVHTIVWS